MTRYLLVAISALAVSACSDNRSYDNESDNTRSRQQTESSRKQNATHSSRSDTNLTVSEQRDMDARNARSRPPIDTNTSLNPDYDNRSTTNLTTGERRDNDAGISGTRTASDAANSNRSDNNNRSRSNLTASDQSENASDRRITQLIRRAVVDDDDLSTKAQNATIITIDGVVTLRGSVDTAAERRLVASKATDVSGVRRVDNHLEIAR